MGVGGGVDGWVRVCVGVTVGGWVGECVSRGRVRVGGDFVCGCECGLMGG